METKILVAYASKYGATKEIAERGGDVLQICGKQVEILPVNGISDVTPYAAVILGSAIYVGKWPKEAEVFLKANEKCLAERPVWLFSSGPTGEGDSVALVDGKCVPTTLRATIDRIKPCDITVFHGNINLEKINAMEKWAVKSVVKKPFGDFRDWNSIVRWSNEIAAAMKDE
jgi:menaquinone-dependent protoporphyrinogen oxidase